MNMARDLAGQKIQIAQLTGQAVPTQQECIQPYLPSNTQTNSHPVPPGTYVGISYEPNADRQALEYVNNNYNSLTPRKHYIENFSREVTGKKFKMFVEKYFNNKVDISNIKYLTL